MIVDKGDIQGRTVSTAIANCVNLWEALRARRAKPGKSVHCTDLSARTPRAGPASYDIEAGSVADRRLGRRLAECDPFKIIGASGLSAFSWPCSAFVRLATIKIPSPRMTLKREAWILITATLWPGARHVFDEILPTWT